MASFALRAMALIQPRMERVDGEEKAGLGLPRKKPGTLMPKDRRL